MKLTDIFRRQPKALDAGLPANGVSPVADAMASNDEVKRKQMLLLSGAGAVALVLGSLYIFDDGKSASDADLDEKVTEVSTDDMVNKSMSEKEWRAQSEAQLQSMRQNTLTEPGCVFMHFLQPQDDSDTWVMIEMFRSRTAWDEHMRQPYNTEGNKLLEGLLREPSDLRLLRAK